MSRTERKFDEFIQEFDSERTKDINEIYDLFKQYEKFRERHGPAEGSVSRFKMVQKEKMNQKRLGQTTNKQNEQRRNEVRSNKEETAGGRNTKARNYERPNKAEYSKPKAYNQTNREPNDSDLSGKRKRVDQTAEEASSSEQTPHNQYKDYIEDFMWRKNKEVERMQSSNDILRSQLQQAMDTNLDLQKSMEEEKEKSQIQEQDYIQLKEISSTLEKDLCEANKKIEFLESMVEQEKKMSNNVTSYVNDLTKEQGRLKDNWTKSEKTLKEEIKKLKSEVIVSQAAHKRSNLIVCELKENLIQQEKEHQERLKQIRESQENEWEQKDQGSTKTTNTGKEDNKIDDHQIQDSPNPDTEITMENEGSILFPTQVTDTDTEDISPSQDSIINVEDLPSSQESDISVMNTAQHRGKTAKNSGKDKQTRPRSSRGCAKNVSYSEDQNEKEVEKELLEEVKSMSKQVTE